MNWSIVKNDFKRNKVINMALLLFMMLSAGLAALSALMGVQTFRSISEFYQKALPPHFVQMHKGEINQSEIERFMSNHDRVVYSQIDTMIDIYGDNLTIVGKEDTFKLSDCRLDIGLVKQNREKDLLLDSDHKKVILKEGEIGIPVLLKEMYHIQIGDRVILEDDEVRRDFVVTTFVLDSTMNSSMASSTRVLLGDTDYEELSDRVGEKEYLIQAYLKSTKDADGFMTDYQDAGLPQNGQAVTYQILFILSALTDIVTIFVMLLVSMLLILISFICVKYTIMAALEEETAEIGTLKAVGLSFPNIRDIYLMKYRILAIAGAVSGYLVALPVSGFFMRHISTTFGISKISADALIAAFFACSLVFLLILYYCKKILKKIRRLTIVDALVTGKGFYKEKGSAKDNLHKAKKLPVSWLMGTHEIIHRFREWVIVFAVVLISVLMTMLPINLLNTFEAPDFITYMGSSLEDILIEIDNGQNLESGYQEVTQVLEQDEAIHNYYEYRTVRVKTANSQMEPMNLDIDCGAYAGNGLQYLSGKAPEGDNEIAISYLNAEETGKVAGDAITVIYGGKEEQLVISGIYQDVTSGGYTAKSKKLFTEEASIKYSFSVNLVNAADAESKAEEWTKVLGAGITIDPMGEFIDQTLGGVSRQLQGIVLAATLISIFLAMLITVLFLKLHLARHKSETAVLKAIGFSNRDIIQQYLIKISCISFAGILVGIALTELLGEQVVNAGLSIAGIGVKRIHLITNPVIEYLICPMLLFVFIILVTGAMLRTTRNCSIITMINE